DVAGSINYNHLLGRANTYFRVGHSFNRHVALGLSVGGGEGMTYNSPHNHGAGFDSAITWHDFRFNSEWLEFRQNWSGRFHSTWERLSYEKLHRLKPFVSRYRWLDKTGSQGSFQSDVVGLNYALTPNLALERVMNLSARVRLKLAI
ncbi:MAG: hypothetical protein JOZ57_01050, partial [Abitibacteriaceae bacterium]|nr:hypothetical protein [Abditibacteriaceae bacterium]